MFGAADNRRRGSSCLIRGVLDRLQPQAGRCPSVNVVGTVAHRPDIVRAGPGKLVDDNTVPAGQAGLFGKLENALRRGFYDNEADAKDRAVRRQQAREQAESETPRQESLGLKSK